MLQNGSPTANWPIRGRWAVASTSTKLRALTTTWSQPPQRRHHTKARPASFQFNKLDDVAAPKIEDERVGDLAHRLDNIFDHHSVEEKVVEVDAEADKPQFDALGHRIPKKKKKKEVEITYRRGAKASADAKEQFKQLRSMMPEAHTYPG